MGIFTQGLNYIVGMLLLITKDERMSFWLIVEILERLVPGLLALGFVGFLIPHSILDMLILMLLGAEIVSSYN